MCFGTLDSNIEIDRTQFGVRKVKLIRLFALQSGTVKTQCDIFTSSDMGIFYFI